MIRPVNFIFFALALLPATLTHAVSSGEAEVKTAFVHHIARFVEWPAPSENGRLQLCILGSDPVAEALARLSGEQIDRLVWEILYVDVRTVVPECRVLFIAASEADHLDNILRSIAGRPILSIGDSDGYATRGVMVNFYSEHSKVRLEINNQAARNAGLKISSQLLKLARVVEYSRGGTR